MKRISIFTTFAVLAINSCCIRPQHAETYTSQVQDATNKIDSLGFHEHSDNCKWILYSYLCEDTCNLHTYVPYADTVVTCGMLDLMPNYVSKSNDTLRIYYNFYLDTFKCDESTCRVSAYTGLEYIYTTVRPVGLISVERGNTYTITAKSDKKHEMIFPKSKNMKAYLKQNRSKLSPWLRAAALERGVLE